jgi:hypothetical protein
MRTIPKIEKKMKITPEEVFAIWFEIKFKFWNRKLFLNAKLKKRQPRQIADNKNQANDCINPKDSLQKKLHKILIEYSFISV